MLEEAEKNGCHIIVFSAQESRLEKTKGLSRGEENRNGYEEFILEAQSALNISKNKS